MRFFACQHIRSNRDFQKIKLAGCRESLGSFAMQIWVPKGSDVKSGRRLGLVASKRVGIAVKRNRAKRIFREIFRLNQDYLPETCDVVIIPYANFEKHSFEELQLRFRDGIAKIRRKLEESGDLCREKLSGL